MRANALTDAELRRKAADELTCMTARINRGEAIPEPVKQLPVMGGRPLNRAQALAKIAEIKAKFGLKGEKHYIKRFRNNALIFMFFFVQVLLVEINATGNKSFSKALQKCCCCKLE